MSKIIEDIEIHMGNQEIGAPDNLRNIIVDFIDGAKRRLEIAVQELDCMEIAEAIIRARQRKVVVKLVIEGDYLTVKKAVKNPFELTGENEVNRQIHDAILRSKIDTKSDFNPKIFHQKFLIRDGSAVLTGSTNFTKTGTSVNLNHIVIVHSRKAANIYTKEFKEIQKGRFGKQSEGHDPHPKSVTVSDIPIKILFAPDHNPEMEIMKQMLKAQKRIDFAIFTFAQSSGIDDTMISLCKSGIKIRGIMDIQQANQKWAATHPIHQAGVELYIAKKKKKLNKLHHKLMVIDEQVLIVGSFNYTNPANLLNDENIMILGNLKGSDTVSQKKQKKLAQYALNEIDRMIEVFGRKI
jgi:phosphatidylserine/phosphatidylglycerophosphate/cardiolipin synthase-like enzyme